MGRNMNNKTVKKTERQAKKDKLDILMRGVDIWASFYRSNPHRFVKDYMGIRLKRFQEIILCMMFRFPNAIFLASRGAGKTYLLAIFCICYCVLYPGSSIRVASRTRTQANQVMTKIMGIMNSNDAAPSLKDEKLSDRIAPSESFIKWKNGSDIAVVTASETGRGQRANVLIIDEFRMLDRDIIDTILKKFLAVPRMPAFMNKPEYHKYPTERNKILYGSSAWYCGHWSYDLVTSYVNSMLTNGKDGSHFCCSIPYHVPYLEGLLDYERFQEDMQEVGFNEITFRMEMEALFFGSGGSGLFSFDDVDKNRRIKYPFYPKSNSSLKISDKKLFIPQKKADELRLLSADIALMASTKHKNDATSIFINQMVPSGNGRYIKNIIYTENNEGLRTEAQALNIRRLFDDYDCDYLIIDIRSVGLGVVDALMADIFDPNTGGNYGALSCVNNKEIAARCLVPNAPKKIWAIAGSDALNSKCALMLREELRQGRVRLLASEVDAEDLLREIIGAKQWQSMSVAERIDLQMPYINTRLLVDELINLETDTRGNTIKIKEKQGMRKDRYSSLSYNIFVSKELERQLNKKRNKGRMDDMYKIPFIPPLIKRKR